MALTQVDQGMLGTNAQYTGFKNRIINGAMVLDQRNAGASVTPTDGQYVLDRWRAVASAASKFTVQQTPSATETGYATRVAAGFTNYMACTSSSAYTVGASETFNMGQIIEGYNWADLAWGTASAATVTLSFWVRSSLTGTFGGSIQNGAGTYSYAFSYTISVANTWEQKTITITGPTAGTWTGATNSAGPRIWFSLGTGATLSTTAGSWNAASYFSATGATSVVGTNGATFYITGVQLEKGSTATSFDYRPYGTELALCQRYFLKDLQDGGTATFLVGVINTVTTGNRMSRVFPVTMRTAPTAAIGGTSNPRIYDGTTPALITGLTTNTCSSFGASLQLEATSGGLVVGRGAVVIDNTASFVTYSAEL